MTDRRSTGARFRASQPTPGAKRQHPIRIVHLGLGAFFRAHQAWYTEQANRAIAAGRYASADRHTGGGATLDPAATPQPVDQTWGIHAFTGRSPAMADELSAQDCLYTLIVRSAVEDRAGIISCISRASDGADGPAWRSAVANPATAVLTITITEAGYLRNAHNGIDHDNPALVADIAFLRSDDDGSQPSTGTASTAPARIVDGLRARWRATGAPLAIVSCDNLPENGRVTRDVVLTVAREVDVNLAAWIATRVSFVSTMVDRITPATTTQDIVTARSLVDFKLSVPVVTEPFSEWVLSGEFPAGRPPWEAAGARFVDVIEPYEQRKLWLLNAGHSLLAYVGLLKGAQTIDEAMMDADNRNLLELLWAEAAVVLPFPAGEIDSRLKALRERFANPRIQHRLSQIAADGSQKLPPRILDVHRARQAAGLPVGAAGAAVIAAWTWHLLGDPRMVSDPAAAELIDALSHAGSGGSNEACASRVLSLLAPDLAFDVELCDVINSALASMAPGSERRVEGWGLN